MGRKALLSFSCIVLIILSAAGQTQENSASTQDSKGASAPPAAAKPPDLSNLVPSLKIAEDFSTPSLKGSEFAPTNALAYESDTEDAFTREITRVAWRPLDPIDLYILRPPGTKKVPVILYLYSYPFDTDRFRDKNFCEFLTKDGFAAVGLATFMTGQRYHERPMKQWFVSEMRESLASSTHDVQLILNYLATRSDLNLDMDRIGVFGDGSGATVAILAASVDPRIKTLDLMDPWGDWPEWMAKSTLVPETERAGFLKPDFLAGIAPLDPVNVFPELKTQKIRLREIMSVTVTPNEAKKKLEAVAPSSVELLRYNTAEEFRNAARVQGFDWIKQQLQPSQTRAADQSTPQGNSSEPGTSHP